MFIIKMTTRFFGISYYIGEGNDFSTDIVKALKYKTEMETELDLISAKKFWDRYKVEVIEYDN